MGIPLIVEEPTCRRLGKCCYYLGEGKEVKKCRYLVGVKGFLRCRIYSNRLGALIDRVDGVEIRCVWRKDSPFDFKGCEYNTNKPILLTPLD